MNLTFLLFDLDGYDRKKMTSLLIMILIRMEREKRILRLKNGKHN